MGKLPLIVDRCISKNESYWEKMAKFKYDQRLVDSLALGPFDFIWDVGNQTKNSQKHDVDCEEAEEVFGNTPLIPLGRQYSPEVTEERFAVLGRTLNERRLFICFTFREEKIRVISARPMSRLERDFYEKVCQELG